MTVDKSKTAPPAAQSCKITRFAFLWMNLIAEPFVAMYTLFPFILRKDVHASAFELALFTSIKPLLAVLAFYWHAQHTLKGQKPIHHLITSWILAYLPYLFFPMLDRYWYFLFAASFYQLFSKAATPALIEILKQNLQKQERERLFSLLFALCFIVSGVIGMGIGKIIDLQPSSWKWLCFVFALLSLSSYWVQRKIPNETIAPSPTPVQKSNFFLAPIKQSLILLLSDKEFRHFQIGYMIGGGALMLMAPAFPLYYVDTLSLKYEEITLARFIFMALGVIASTYFWRKALSKISLNRLNAWILTGFGLFPLLLLFALFNKVYLHIAFILYGIAQAGSHLVWNLSGTFFSKDKDSSPYTAVSILLQGIRGTVFPFLGAFLCHLIGPVPVLIIGSCASFYGVKYLSSDFSKTSISIRK